MFALQLLYNQHCWLFSAINGKYLLIFVDLLYDCLWHISTRSYIVPYMINIKGVVF